MTKLLWVVDAQNDFFDEPYKIYDWTNNTTRMQNPALPVPGSKAIRANLAQLLQFTRGAKDWNLFGTLDAHTNEDVQHFTRWPVHCLNGTPGFFPISEVDTRSFITNRVGMEKLASLEFIFPKDREILFFEKRERPEDTNPNACNSCRVNPNVAPLLQIVKPELIVICGLALGYCVKEARDYFKELGYKVALVTDAIKEFNAEELALYGKWHAEGDILVHTNDVIEEKLI